MKVCLSLVERSNRTAPVVVDLPALLGRGQNDEVFVESGGRRKALHVADRRVSRRHLEIVEASGGIGLRDMSRNGTYMLSGESEARLRGETGGLEALRRVRLGTLLLDVAPADVVSRAVKIRLTTPGGRETVLDLSERPFIAMTAGGRLALERTAARRPGGVLTLRSGTRGALLEVSEAGASVVRLNRGHVGAGAYDLAHLDVIEVAGHALTVWEAIGPRGLRCPNHDCLLLNPYDTDGNCAFCGAKLDSGVTFVVE